ncbi:hypothetical protein [Paenibacillus gansuensis]|uniref:HTH cro/C1-type domain-containing protein n=1 Tax=Paenibacillus gansuensis TaxID=306542 RepID=A0ABW5PEY0_9BACL
MPKQINEQDVIRFIEQKTKINAKHIAEVLKFGQSYLNSVKANARGEVDIDMDDIVDYVLKRPGMKLNELQVEEILETEMDYLIKKGIASYGD